jgi:vacuolar-type H+-ATPase catalytic subunit A/Vma1
MKTVKIADTEEESQFGYVYSVSGPVVITEKMSGCYVQAGNFKINYQVIETKI